MIHLQVVLDSVVNLLEQGILLPKGGPELFVGLTGPRGVGALDLGLTNGRAKPPQPVFQI
jgi:hypothetical protein